MDNLRVRLTEKGERAGVTQADVRSALGEAEFSDLLLTGAAANLAKAKAEARIQDADDLAREMTFVFRRDLGPVRGYLEHALATIPKLIEAMATMKTHHQELKARGDLLAADFPERRAMPATLLSSTTISSEVHRPIGMPPEPSSQ